MRRYAKIGLVGLLAVMLGFSAAPAAADDEEAAGLVRTFLEGDVESRLLALEQMQTRGDTDVVPSLINLLRFLPVERAAVIETLEIITGESHGADWFEWMLWLEAHPEVEPYEGFDAFKADYLSRIDPNFRVFLKPGVDHEIRLEEIVWGGVRKDGIPALNNPKFLEPNAADYITSEELVFGVAINGDVRAYPLRIMDWHEMANDVVGGVPVALAYCTLCSSGILYDTSRAGSETPFIFGSSGFLYRSNKLMYDHLTHSLWNQFTGRPVVGELTGTGIELPILPIAITSWADWLEKHPGTKVLSLDTGFSRDYTPGRPYGEYFAQPELMFPARVEDTALEPKDYVFRLRHEGAEKAWALDRFEDERLVYDTLAGRSILLIGNAETRTVRAYATDGRQFEDAGEVLRGNGEIFEIREDALIGADGASFARLPGHIGYWFAYQNYRDAAS